MSIAAHESVKLKGPDEAVDLIDELVWVDDERDDLIGLEIEAFPMAHGPAPGSRLTLHGPNGVLEALRASLGASCGSSTSHPPFFSLGDRGHVTFEPGGQIEISSSARSDTASLRADIDNCSEVIEQALEEFPAGLVCLGIDPWHGVDEVPLQQRFGRYVAMDHYFSTRWPAGQVMMRNTCSLQVSLDSGAGGTRQERWLVANLMSPVLGAMFSTSPGSHGTACSRARVWQGIDPTRTGYPTWRSADQVDALDDVRKRTLDATVMFVVREGAFIPIEQDMSFEEWIRLGHPEFGLPTKEDLRTHLSTIFTEVRPRNGTLELRAMDSLPKRWWMVPAVVAGGIVYDSEARGRAIELLSQFSGRLDQLWRTSAEVGLRDPELADAASRLSQLALEATARTTRFDPEAVSVTGEFFDRFTWRSQSPGDELRSVLFGVDAVDRTMLELSGVGCA